MSDKEKKSVFWKGASVDLLLDTHLKIWMDLKRHVEEKGLFQQEIHNWKGNMQRVLAQLPNDLANCEGPDNVACVYLAQRRRVKFEQIATNAGINVKDIQPDQLQELPKADSMDSLNI